MTDYLIRGADVLGRGAADIAIQDGRIVDPELLGTSDYETVDAAGLVALPGLVDMHTHLREPGKEDAETVLTGSRSAASGGFTCVHAMANTAPVADTAGVVEQVHRLGRAAGFTEVVPVGAVTTGLEGKQLAELGAMARSGARVRMFSDDGICVSDPLLMRRALEYVKTFDGIIAQHAQEPRLTEGAQMNEGTVSSELGLPGWPAVAEESIIARDVLLAEHVGSRLHICHVSTAGSVDLIRWAKARGIAVTAEVTPHHLMLTDELVRTFDPVYKVNPPLRTDRDVQALREALADGTIDVVGTDHAPHTAEHKCSEWTAAAMGMVGMESALSIVVAAMAEHDFDFGDVARVMSSAPARITGASGHGSLEIGASANIVLVDPSAPHRIEPGDHATKGRNNPFAGVEVTARVTDTFFYGHRVLAAGSLATPHPAGATWTPQ
ncbi:dihydroorotase [Brevibacterium iodinum ATCC 49514]|uniref:Dihydroorotase n=1 Tax=Brevibacterium iodinum ATCC 49514 TaxID=1255616 RepID=A0A2H1I868_9MICO|nr:dihydroorotase [Brevibacterium iodinum]SMX71343.1 dihydroorotase [Brevibacterium iodinum ATCC 49514]SUW12657.1 Dihydroorotase [Brevibacterium iodinum]